MFVFSLPLGSVCEVAVWATRSIVRCEGKAEWPSRLMPRPRAGDCFVSSRRERTRKG